MMTFKNIQRKVMARNKKKILEENESLQEFLIDTFQVCGFQI